MRIAPKSTWGGKRVSKKEPESYNLPANSNIERAASDWIPIGKTVGIEITEPESSQIFYSFGALDDGYLIEEILSPEDMYPAMYRRVVIS